MKATSFPIFDFDPHNLPADVLEAVGLAVTCGAQTEYVIAMAIGGCLGIDSEYAAAVTTHMTLPLKLSVLRSAAEIRIDSLDDLDELDRLIESAEKALGMRHTLAHASIFQEPPTGRLFRIKQVARTRLEADKVPITAKSVKAEAELIYAAGLALMTFIGERGLLPPHSAPRPRGHKAKAARKKRRKQRQQMPPGWGG
jgi:hypothetical protein